MRNEVAQSARDKQDVFNFEPRPFRWTVEAYFQACEAGLFLDTRVQLIDGEIIEMPAQKNWHALGLSLTLDALQLAFGPNCWVRPQMSLDLSPWSMPDPDLLVISGAKRSHAGPSIPTGGLLVVEVAETTLRSDRNRKSHLYAAGGLSEYWILNVVDRQLEVYRDPIADPSVPFGHRYQTRTDLVAGDVVSPLALPGASIAVIDLLP